MKRLTVFWALLACLLLAAPAMAVETTATGKVVATVTRDVRLPFNAVIDEVLVRPGDAIKAGDPLVRYHLQDEAERVLQREVTTGAATESLRGQILDLERELVQARAERNRVREMDTRLMQLYEDMTFHSAAENEMETIMFESASEQKRRNLLVDAANKLQEAGYTLVDAVKQAAQQRIRPILMTTLTTILAMLPMCFGFGEGASLRSPMALAVIGGLVTSTLMSLVVIPCVYYIFDKKRK